MQSYTKAQGLLMCVQLLAMELRSTCHLPDRCQWSRDRLRRQLRLDTAGMK